MTTWNEGKPTSSDPLNELPSVLSQHKVAFREGIEKHFYWRDNSGTSAGEPRFTTSPFDAAGPGSARAFYAPQSAVSASKTGRLFLTSDTSRLFTVPDTAPALLGSVLAVVGDSAVVATTIETTSFETVALGTRWLVQSGSTTSLAAASRLTFPTAYVVAPRVLVSPLVSTATVHAYRLALTSVQSSYFSWSFARYGSATSVGFFWRSVGTVPLV